MISSSPSPIQLCFEFPWSFNSFKNIFNVIFICHFLLIYYVTLKSNLIPNGPYRPKIWKILLFETFSLIYIVWIWEEDNNFYSILFNFIQFFSMRSEKYFSFTNWEKKKKKFEAAKSWEKQRNKAIINFDDTYCIRF